MIQQVARVGRRSWVVFAIAVGLLLAAAGSAVLPAAPASASTTVVAVFSSSNEYITPLCSDPGTYDQSGSAVEVYNPCSTRVWVHYYSGSSVETYCVNPGGGLAYDLPIRWAGGDTSDLQITTNKSQCDAGVSFAINWFAGGYLIDSESNVCQPNQTFTEPAGVYAEWITDGGCDFRIWLHGENGTSPSSCYNGTGDSPTVTTKTYFQVQTTYNQAPCDAGGPPYPY
jgi:hypothetical protein